MSQALRDLPDPTQPAPVLPAANADDLLAKMADEAIDKLMAEADKGPTAPAIKLRQPTEEKPPEEAVVAEAAVADMLADAAKPISPVAERVSTTEAAITPPAEPSPTTATPVESPVVESPVVKAEAASSTNAVEPATPVATAEAPAVLPASAEPPKDDVKALLTEEIQTRPSPLLWPLWLLNAPFAWMSDRARQTLGLIGIVTLVPAVCAIVYVLYMKKY